MDPMAIVEQFSGDAGREQAMRYLQAEGLLAIIEARLKEDGSRIVPDPRDLGRLHAALRARKAFTALEFGVGFSTLVIADALYKNRQGWDALPERPKIRSEMPFQLHSVDASEAWIAPTEAMVPDHLKAIVFFHHSPCVAGTFQDRVCHFYERLPNVVSDFIYLDGPDPADVKGDVGGLAWSNPDRVVMAGDILRMEPTLLPGTLLLIDGRTSNARFLEAHLYRNWQGACALGTDVTAMELQEAPLGRITRDRLSYCLGARTAEW
jgi:hypothetical protein